MKRILGITLEGKIVDPSQPGCDGKAVLTEEGFATYLHMPYQAFEGVSVPGFRIDEAKRSIEQTLNDADPNMTVGQTLIDYWGFVETSAASVPSGIMQQMCKCFAHAAKEMGLAGVLDCYVYHG